MAEDLKAVYLLGGTDRPKITRALGRLRGRFEPETVELLFADTTAGENVVAACNALGLFAAEAGRLVIVEGIDRWKAADTKAVVDYLKDPAPATVLALVGEEVKAESPLAKACKAAGEVLSWNVQKKRLPEWVAEHLARVGAQADREACQALVELVGDDLDELASEADKLATWAGGDPIDVDAVEALAVHARETTPWALSDAWGERDLARILAACEAELERREPFLVAVRLAGHVGLVRDVRELSELGRNTREIAKSKGVHEFRVRKALGHAEAYSREELDGALVRLAELDAALKGASRLPGELEVTRAVLDITRERVPLGR